MLQNNDNQQFPQVLERRDHFLPLFWWLFSLRAIILLILDCLQINLLNRNHTLFVYFCLKILMSANYAILSCQNLIFQTWKKHWKIAVSNGVCCRSYKISFCHFVFIQAWEILLNPKCISCSVVLKLGLVDNYMIFAFRKVNAWRVRSIPFLYSPHLNVDNFHDILDGLLTVYASFGRKKVRSQQVP